MGISHKQDRAAITLIASEKNWIETEALDQLHWAAELPGMVQAVGLPDLHPGKGIPVGAVFVSRDYIYPELIGNDIGCGMGLWQTTLKSHKFKIDKAVRQLTDLESCWGGDHIGWRANYQIDQADFDAVLGTIGGGNHFAEIQKISKICQPDLAEQLGLTAKNLYLLVHSGSRGYGEKILQNSRAEMADSEKSGALSVSSPQAHTYIRQHDQAIAWAVGNRALIARRMLDKLGASGMPILDVTHNLLTSFCRQEQQYWVHRKGATPADQGPVMIPGSRGSQSYLVQPIGNQHPNAYSLAHGAGRKWKRRDVKAKLGKVKSDQLTRTVYGSQVICENKALIFEEAPQAYKNIDQVIQDMLSAGLIEVIAIFDPVITYKTRRSQHD